MAVKKKEGDSFKYLIGNDVHIFVALVDFSLPADLYIDVDYLIREGFVTDIGMANSEGLAPIPFMGEKVYPDLEHLVIPDVLDTWTINYSDGTYTFSVFGKTKEEVIERYHNRRCL